MTTFHFRRFYEKGYETEQITHTSTSDDDDDGELVLDLKDVGGFLDLSEEDRVRSQSRNSDEEIAISIPAPPPENSMPVLECTPENIEKIISAKKYRGVTKYKVLWKGLGQEFCAWREEKEFKGCESIIQAWKMEQYAQKRKEIYSKLPSSKKNLEADRIRAEPLGEKMPSKKQLRETKNEIKVPSPKKRQSITNLATYPIKKQKLKPDSPPPLT